MDDDQGIEPEPCEVCGDTPTEQCETCGWLLCDGCLNSEEHADHHARVIEEASLMVGDE